MIKTSDGVFYQKTQTYFKPYTPQKENAQSTQPVPHLIAQSHQKQPVKQPMVQSDQKKSLPVNNPTQVTTSRPKRDTKIPVRLDL